MAAVGGCDPLTNHLILIQLYVVMRNDSRVSPPNEPGQSRCGSGKDSIELQDRILLS